MTAQAISPADRIRELSVINKDVALMLQSASQALSTLTDTPASAHIDDGADTEMTDTDGNGHLDARKRGFERHATDYYTSLQAVIARLRRQAYALEEAGIIAPEAAALSTTSTAQRQGAAPVSEPERITNGGLGNLDIGWLNSRGNKVGAEKENELLKDTKSLLEDMLAKDDRELT